MKTRALTLLPMAQEIELEAGQDYIGHITVANSADATSDLPYSIDVVSYAVVDEKYTADFSSKKDSTQIVDWIEVPQSTGTVKPNESANVEFIVHVPWTAPSGGQYAALSVAVTDDTSADDMDQGAFVHDKIEMVSILYATVKGNTVHKGEIYNNEIPSFATSSPIFLTSSVQNEGNVHEPVSFTITATDAITGRSIIPNDKNDGYSTEMIMPGTVYSAVRELDGLPLIGAIRVTQEISFGEEKSYAENLVLLCPLWFIVLVGLTLISFILVLITLVRRHRRRRLV